MFFFLCNAVLQVNAVRERPVVRAFHTCTGHVQRCFRVTNRTQIWQPTRYRSSEEELVVVLELLEKAFNLENYLFGHIDICIWLL